MRSALAILGGYAFTYALTAALARLLPLSPADALVVATLPTFLVYTVAILWAFAARDLDQGSAAPVRTDCEGSPQPQRPQCA